MNPIFQNRLTKAQYAARAALAVSLLWSASPVLAQPAMEAVAAERAEAEKLLEKIAEDEKRLLSSASEPTQGKKVTVTGSSSALEQRLAEALQTKQALERRQGSFIEEILKLRKKIKNLEVRAQKVEEESFAYREQELKEEIRRESSRAAKLERELAEERERDKDARKAQRANVDLSDELAAERKRMVLKDKKIAELERTIEISRQAGGERDELKRNYIKAKQRAEQLELELQARKSLETDNQFLRSEVKKLEEALAKTRGVASSAQNTSAQLNTLRAEKEAAEAKLAGQQDKIQKVVEKIQQLMQRNEALVGEVTALKKDLQQKNEIIAKSSSFGGDLKKLHNDLAASAEQLRGMKDERDALAQELKSLTEKQEALISERDAAQKALAERNASESPREQELTDLKRQLSKTIEETRVCQLTVDEKQTMLGKLPELQAKVQEQQTALAEAAKSKQSCEQELRVAKNAVTEVQELKRALVSAKNEILLYQTEMQVTGKQGGDNAKRAQRIRERAAMLRAQQSGVTAAPVTAAAVDPGLLMEQGKLAASEDLGRKPAPPPLSDVMLVEVKGSKVNLRSGPGEEHSAVMQVHRGTRLTVEARQGDWFRVFTPTGGRAYISAQQVRSLEQTTPPAVAANPAPPLVPSVPGRGPSVPAARAIRDTAVIPFGQVNAPGSSDVEARALERLRSGLGKGTEGSTGQR